MEACRIAFQRGCWSPTGPLSDSTTCLLAHRWQWHGEMKKILNAAKKTNPRFKGWKEWIDASIKEEYFGLLADAGLGSSARFSTTPESVTKWLWLHNLQVPKVASFDHEWSKHQSHATNSSRQYNALCRIRFWYRHVTRGRFERNVNLSVPLL